MSQVDPTESAYPKTYSDTIGCEGSYREEIHSYGGINVRTYIATHVLTGMMASPGNPALNAGPGEMGLTISQLVAKRCVLYADVLIAELNKADSE